MASDEIVWQVINEQFCSYKLKTTKNQSFCRNEYNVTGLCSRQACPLANSQYATVRANPDTGVLYLFMKTVERSHMPSKLWERIRLSGDYAKALEQIDERLRYWPKFLSHKCKQRLTRLTQVAIRTRRIAKEEQRLGERVVTKMAPKIRKREEGRERKAEAAAKVERNIERELIRRLREGAYGDRPLNVEEGVWKKVLKGLERGGEGQRDVDLDEGIEEEEEGEVEREFESGDVEYVSDIDGASDDEADVGDLEDWLDGNSEDGESDDDDDDGDSDEASSGDSEDEDEDEHGDEEEDAALKKTIAGLKRKKPDTKPPARPAKKGVKGPRREIEYEIENEPPERQVAYA